MGEIRIVSPGKTRGYPYPVCKKTIFRKEAAGGSFRVGAFIRVNTIFSWAS